MFSAARNSIFFFLLCFLKSSTRKTKEEDNLYCFLEHWICGHRDELAWDLYAARWRNHRSQERGEWEGSKNCCWVHRSVCECQDFEPGGGQLHETRGRDLNSLILDSSDLFKYSKNISQKHELLNMSAFFNNSSKLLEIKTKKVGLKCKCCFKN